MKKIQQILIIFSLIILPTIANAIVYVETRDVSSITYQSALLRGRITDSSGKWEGITLYFRYSENPPEIDPDLCDDSFGVKTPNAYFQEPTGFFNYVNFSSPINGLKEKTSYYYCAIAIAKDPVSNLEIKTFGKPKFFTTSAKSSVYGNILLPETTSELPPPNNIGKVTTHEVPLSELNDREATFVGHLESLANTDPVYGYFRYTLATSRPPLFCNDIYGSRMKAINATDPDKYGTVNPGAYFYGFPKNLIPDTEYAYCAVVSNNASNPTEIKYGEVKTFRTEPCATCDKSSITTRYASKIESTKAILNGYFSSTKANTTYFEYKEIPATSSPDPLFITKDVWITTPTNNNGVNSFGKIDAKLSNLKPNTTYQYKAVLETANPFERKEGSIFTFKTHQYDGIGPTEEYEEDEGDGNGSGTEEDEEYLLPKMDLKYFPATTYSIVIPLKIPNAPTIVPNSWVVEWASENTNSCNSGAGNPTATAGHFFTGTLTKSRSYTVSCTGEYGTVSDTVYININNNIIPKVTVTATPATLPVGGGTALVSWTSTNTTSCSANGNSGLNVDGSFSTGVLTKSKTFTVTCLGANGSGKVSGSVYIYVDDGQGGGGFNNNTFTFLQVTLNATPATVKTGGASTITWNANANVASCEINGYTGTSGSFSTGTLEKGQSYSVECIGKEDSGTVSASVYVSVNDGFTPGGPGGQNNFPKVTMTANPTSGKKGDSSTISWTSTNTTSCNAGAGNPTGTSGSFSTGPLEQSRSYSVTCTGENGTASAMINIFVYGQTFNTGNFGNNIFTPTFNNIEGIGNITGFCENGECKGTWDGIIPDYPNGPITNTFTGPFEPGTFTGFCENGECKGTWENTIPGFPDGPVDWEWVGSENYGDFDFDNQNEFFTSIFNFDGINGTGNFTGICVNGSCGGNWSGIIPGFPDGPISSTFTSPFGTGTFTGICVNGACSGNWNGNVGPSGPVTGTWNGSNGNGDIFTSIFNGLNGTGTFSGTCTASGCNGNWSGIIPGQNGDVSGVFTGENGTGTFTGTCVNGACSGTWTGGTGNGTILGTWNGSNGNGDGLFTSTFNGLNGTGVFTGTCTANDCNGTWNGIVPGYPDGPISGTFTGENGTGTFTGTCVNGACSGTWSGSGGASGPILGTWTGSNGNGRGIGTGDDVNKIPYGDDGKPLQIGSTATPDIDDIVRYHEGIEHVFARRIKKSPILQERYGYIAGTDLNKFAGELAHTLAKQFGYVDGTGREIRVTTPDVSAYQLRLIGEQITVYEYYKNKIIDIRKASSPFKIKNPYEYYFNRKAVNVDKGSVLGRLINWF